MHYMILMSKKMTTQKKLGEIKVVPYDKPLTRCDTPHRTIPGGTIGYPAQPGLIRFYVRDSVCA